jgi:putative oxidoreductase
MAAFMKPYSAQTYAVLRIVAGLLFMAHGLQKLVGWPLPVPEQAPAFVIWIAGSIELFGGLLIAIGLFTTWAAFLSSGLMAAAYWIGHGTNHWIPLVNQGELAALYCFLFLMIAAHGSGIWSADAARGTA